MGMYTSIIHPKYSRELQIKTGFDDCERYHIGDTVRFYVNKDIFGYGGIFDGVYDSMSNKGDDDWVIIKDHKIIAIRSRKRNKYQDLIKQYKIKKPSKKLWTERAYQKHKIQQAKFREENRKFNASIKHLPPNERFAAILGRPIKEMMKRQGFARRVFKLKKSK